MAVGLEKLVVVALGGAGGSVARYLTGVAALRLVGPGLPWLGTITVNIVGGCLMGLLVGFLAHRGGVDQERFRLLIAVGVLGGFTTFSAFSLEVALMIQRREHATALLYAMASVVLAVSALFAGLAVGRRLFAV